MSKINQKGLAHTILPLLVMVVMAVGGTYLIVASHASATGGSDPATRKYKTPGGSRRRIVEVAKSELGYAEGPNNTVKFWETRVPNPPISEAWCADFATWVWHAAGVDLNGQPYPRQNNVGVVMNTGKADGRFHTSHPQPGDAIIYGPGGDDHIGIVEKVSGSNMTVIEGNAGNNDTSIIRRGINLKHPKNIPHGVIYGYVTPPGV